MVIMRILVAASLIAAGLAASLGDHPLRPPLPPHTDRQGEMFHTLGDAANFTRADATASCHDRFDQKCELCCGPPGLESCCEDLDGALGLPADIATVTFTVRFTLIVDDTNTMNWSLSDEDALGQVRVLDEEFTAAGSRFRFQLPRSNRTNSADTTAAPNHANISANTTTVAAAAITVLRSTVYSRNCPTDACYKEPSTCGFNTIVLPNVRSTPSADINVIVCDIPYDGESQFPWATKEEGSYLQYIQVRYGAFYNKGAGTPRDGGKTLVHEMGHYLGLLHTFDGPCRGVGDYVSDTPPSAHAANPKNACGVVDAQEWCASEGAPSPQGQHQDDMSLAPDTSNFMDYSADRCMSRFTSGQVRRMEQAVMKYRTQLLFNSTATVLTYAAANGTNSTNGRPFFSITNFNEWWSSNNNGSAVVLIAMYVSVAAAASRLATRSARRRYRPMHPTVDGETNEERYDGPVDDDHQMNGPMLPWSPKWLRRHYRRRRREVV